MAMLQDVLDTASQRASEAFNPAFSVGAASASMGTIVPHRPQQTCEAMHEIVAMNMPDRSVAEQQKCIDRIVACQHKQCLVALRQQRDRVRQLANNLQLTPRLRVEPDDVACCAESPLSLRLRGAHVSVSESARM